MAFYVVTGSASCIGSGQALVERGSRCGWSTVSSPASARISRRFGLGPPEGGLASDVAGQAFAALITSSIRRRFRRCPDRWRTPDVASRQRRRDIAALARRARQRREADRVRGIIVGVRRCANVAEARGHAGGAAIAVRAPEAHRRAVHADVHHALRSRDGDDPLLQRVRSTPGSVVAAPASSRSSRPRCWREARDDRRRRRADARLHLTCPTSSTGCCAPSRRRRRPGR